jgi:hypothetical protein
MRALCLIVCVVSGVAFAGQPARHSLTTAEAAALKESVALGHRVLSAWSHYSEVTGISTPISAGVDVISSTPTLELLHATHSLSDSDFAVSLRCQAKLYPVPVDAPKDAPILSLHTDLGELVFDIGGNITLQPPK